MWTHRTPVKPAKPAEEAPKDPQGRQTRSPTPVAHSSQTTSVRRSVGEWESGKPDPLTKTPTTPKKTKPQEPPKVKPKAKFPQVQPRVVTRRESTEAPEVLPTLEQRSRKLSDRMAEAKACFDAAMEHLGNSRNIKTEIKKEVSYALTRLFQLVKESESGRKTNTQEATLEKEEQQEVDRETEKRKEKEGELSKKLEEHSRLLEENNRKMEKLQESLEKQQEMQQRQSYASVAAAVPKRPEQTALHSVVVTAVDEMETGEEVLDRIRKAVNAKESGIVVERIRKAKDRKVIVGCKTEEERQRVKERLRAAKELNVEDIKNKNPLVILKDVLKYNTDEDVLNALRNQNKGIIGELGEQTMEIAFKKRTRNPHTHHIIMRVSPKLWRHLTDAGTVLIDLQRARVEDQSPLVQCSLCLGYGHGRRFCTETVEKCSHCGGPHMKAECADWLAEAPPSCPNCVRAKADKTDHNAFSNACPIRRKWEALARATIAYC